MSGGPKGDLHFLTAVHELCKCSFVLLFLGATKAEVCDVLGVATAFADKEGGHRHSLDDSGIRVRYQWSKTSENLKNMENEWNSRKLLAADMRSGSLAI